MPCKRMTAIAQKALFVQAHVGKAIPVIQSDHLRARLRGLTHQPLCRLQKCLPRVCARRYLGILAAGTTHWPSQSGAANVLCSLQNVSCRVRG